jgi:DNA replication protein DnaD
MAIYEDEPTKDTLDEDAILEGFWAEKAKETTATLQRLLENTGANFLEIQLNMLGKQIVAGAATVENPLVNPDSFINSLGFDVSSGKNKKILTDLFGENDTISAYQLATSLGYTKKQFTSIPAQAQRITAETPAMRELFKDQDYKATPFELEDAVLNGKTAEEVAEYVDPRYVTEAEAIAAFEAENGYRPSAEEIQDRIGQAEYTGATDAAGQEAYVNRTANHEQAELDDLKYYVDARQITVDEVKEFAAQNGLTISDKEAEKLARQGSLEEIVNEEQKIFNDFDERFVTRAELEGIARAEGYDPASLTEEDYAEFSGETSQSDAVKAIDTRATTEEELIEVFEQRTGIALDPYNPEDREKLTDMMEAATAANGGVVPSDAEFKAWTKKNIEYDLGVQVGRLATGVRNAIFGTGPGGRPKTLQEILDELLGPPSTAGFGGKSPLVIKTTPGGAIGAPSTGVFGSPNVQVEIKFPVPLPVNGPPIIVPLYEEGVYVGPSSAGELLVGEDGVITQVKDNVTTTVGRISGQVVQVVGAAGEVIKAIPLGALDNPGWREGDKNPFEIEVDENGVPALVDENGIPIDPDTGLPVYEQLEDEDETT